MSSEKKQLDINSIITKERQSMFLSLDDKPIIKHQANINNNLFYDTLYDKKIFYNSNIKINR